MKIHMGGWAGRLSPRASGALAILGMLAACTTAPEVLPPAPSAPPAAAAPRPIAPSASGAASSAAAAAPAPAVPATVYPRAASRWVAVGFDSLPGWSSDRSAQLWPALLLGCQRPAAVWAALCAEARLKPPADDAAARAWLMQRLQPFRVESHDGIADGLITGYFEPLVEARRSPRGAFRVALHAPPDDLATRQPYWTRQQLDTVPKARSALRGSEIAYVADPLDALVLQIQGSGRLVVRSDNGQVETVRVAYAGHNGQPYGSVGRWLVERGELKLDQASWPGIKQWARDNPKRVQALLWSNPRVVFFREEALDDPQRGPRGAQGVPLSPGRSIAVDPQSVPYGTPVWLDTTEPLSKTPLQRLVMAQDTGSAITGAVRADYFWGWEGNAEAQAGRMKQPLRLWVLWPRGATP